MSSEASGALHADLGLADEQQRSWKLRFRKPANEHGFGFGFLFRFVIAVVASLVFVVLMMTIGLFTQWQPGTWALWFCGGVSVAILLAGEHIRSRVYERVSEITDPHVDVEVHLSKLPEFLNTERPDGTVDSDTRAEFVRQELSSRQAALVIKRLIDMLFASVALIVLCPLLIAVATMVLFDVGSPIMFWQQRPGFHGKPFRLFKFRTMRPDHGDYAAGHFDPRITRVGRFLRASRLDETPQLFNVLFGQMSLVGPRALLPIDGDAERLHALLEMKPGVTGWAQIQRLKLGSTAMRYDADMYYVKHWSLWLDLKIMAITVGHILTGRWSRAE